MASFALFVPAVLLAIFVQNGESVRCFTCSSEMSGPCADPFYLGGNQYYGQRLDNCDANSASTYPYLANSKSVCRKMVKYTMDGRYIITRGCTWKRVDDHSTTCPSVSTNPNEHTTFCETCEYDGCNSASALAKTIALLAAPLALLLFK